MQFRIHPGSGMPIYLQLMQQIRHAIETGALQTGDQLPGLRKLAETLVMNPNTVAKAYRELEHEGVIELRHGSGAFIAEQAQNAGVATLMKEAQPIVEQAVERLMALGLNEQEVRRLVDAVLMQHKGSGDGTHGD
ncbi:MAG: GntR family transcriptional regulator [Bryobacteraceae bacterium]|nr:GntR family transcriptional regulator [Bryobacteraceae bacterium]